MQCNQGFLLLNVDMNLHIVIFYHFSRFEKLSERGGSNHTSQCSSFPPHPLHQGFIVGSSVDSPPALVSNDTEHTETECLETECAEVSENGEHLESNDKDALNKLEGEESSKGKNTNTDDGQVRAVDLVGEMPPPLKSAFKTPSPKPEKSLLSSLFGGGSGQKKAHVSFGVNKSTTYTPPDSDGCNTPNAWNQ